MAIKIGICVYVMGLKLHYKSLDNACDILCILTTDGVQGPGMEAHACRFYLQSLTDIITSIVPSVAHIPSLEVRLEA